MKALQTTLQQADQAYWADRTEEQMLTVSAWIAVKEGATDRALQFMQAAADGEDGSVKHVAMEESPLSVPRTAANYSLRQASPLLP